MSEASLFRKAWGKFPTGVSVITTIEPNGDVHGMTANGINSVSLNPLLILACVGHSANTHQLIRKSERFAINILSETQESIGRYYALPVEDRTVVPEAGFNFTATGSALLKGSLATMDCHVVNHHEAGDHTIFIGEVDQIEVHEGKPLVFFEGNWRGLTTELA